MQKQLLQSVCDMQGKDVTFGTEHAQQYDTECLNNAKALMTTDVKYVHS